MQVVQKIFDQGSTTVGKRGKKESLNAHFADTSHNGEDYWESRLIY